MKNRLTPLMVLTAMLSSATSSYQAFGQDNPELSLDGNKMEEHLLDEQANAADGQKHVADKIKNRFGVNDETIRSLREKNFGYGEIATTLSLAERMKGGVTDENIQKIVALRTGENKTGWGNIAKQFDVSVGDLKKNVTSVRSTAEAGAADTPRMKLKSKIKQEMALKQNNANRGQLHKANKR